ncbi:MAG: head decoration protein [Vicingaceae bacterium]
MSSAEVKLQTSNQLFVDYDYSKIFIFNNDYIKGDILNNTGAERDFLPGTLLGRISASGKLVELDPAAADGSQFPVGILKTCVLALGDTLEAKVNACNGGEVTEEMLILKSGVTLDDIVTGGVRLRDMIASANLGIKLVKGIELTKADNS